MIRKIIAFSANNRLLIFALTFVLMLTSWWCVKNLRLDALPDLSDTQVIVLSRWDRSPDIIEDQVTYPIVSALLGTPNVKTIRGFSDFGYSYVYVIFEDGTDVYWARSRVLEYLSKITAQLPSGVKTELGPDATSIGWVFQYALVDKTGQNSLQDLRSFQDWTLRYQLQSVPGVAEVATVGGGVKQYQVNIDPRVLLETGISLNTILEAIRNNNNDSGARLVEWSGREYMVRGRGYLRSLADIENIGVGLDERTQTPLLIKDVAFVSEGPDITRGVAELDGEGEVIGGVVLMRNQENALQVIERVKQKISELKSSFPQGVELVVTYDRSDLIHRAIETLKRTLFDEMLIVSLIIFLFLYHIPSAIVPVLTIPLSVFFAFIPFYLAGMTANIMSLAGIAISIGILVDGAIIEIENAYNKMHQWIAGGKKGDPHLVRLHAMQEVGPSVFFSLLVITVSFLPIFTLLDQEGRLFRPLALSKTLAMLIAALLAITLDPALRMLFTRVEPFTTRKPWLNKILDSTLVGKYYAEHEHPISRVLQRVYEPICRKALTHRKLVLAGALGLMLLSVPVFLRLGSEFMPPLHEGAIVYMPTTLPGISITEAKKSLALQDRLLKEFPEVERVFGKVGRAESATDPAPLSMVETTIVLKPESQWPQKKSYEALVQEMHAKLQIPGWVNAWTMPIKNRIDMLTTGIRTPVGIKIYGDDVKTLEHIGQQIESFLKPVEGTRSVFSERTAGGYYLDYELKRDKLAQYSLSVNDVEMLMNSALGGERLTTTVEGRERYGVAVRYFRELRDDWDELKNVLVTTPAGAHIPLSEVAELKIVTGPSMIRDENGKLSSYVYIDIDDRDIGSYVKDAKTVLAASLTLPTAYSLEWSGQFENMQRVKERLKVVLPLTLALIIFLLFFNTKSWIKTGIVLLAVPFSLIGAVWFLWLMNFNLSIAVWVGMIALMGLDAETGIFMLLFLDLSYDEAKQQGKLTNQSELTEAIVHGAVKRLRPKLMTVAAAFVGLLPIMWSHGAGADVMQRIAAPMIGGLISSFLLELLVYPVIYFEWKKRKMAPDGDHMS